MDDPKCKHYKPIDKNAKVNCSNCYRWIGIECMDHWAMVSRVITSRKFDAYDRMMRENRGVRIDAK